MLIKKGFFSELFPKTFAYLQQYIRAKYPDFDGKTPDVKVRVVRGGWRLIKSQAHYNALTNRIIICIDHTLPKMMSSPANKEAAYTLLSKETLEKYEAKYKKDFPDLICRYLDTNSFARSVLIHEYQHYLQYTTSKIPFRLKIVLPSSAQETPHEKIEMAIQNAVHRSSIVLLLTQNSHLQATALALVGLHGAYRAGLYMFAPKVTHFTVDDVYTFNEKEIEARLTQMVYNLVIGKPVQKFDLTFHETEKKIRASMETLEAGITEQEELKAQTNWRERRIIKKRIRLMNELYWEYERKLKVIRDLAKEDERIAEKIKAQFAGQ